MSFSKIDSSIQLKSVLDSFLLYGDKNQEIEEEKLLNGVVIPNLATATNIFWRCIRALQNFFFSRKEKMILKVLDFIELNKDLAIGKSEIIKKIGNKFISKARYSYRHEIDAKIKRIVKAITTMDATCKEAYEKGKKAGEPEIAQKIEEAEKKKIQIINEANEYSAKKRKEIEEEIESKTKLMNSDILILSNKVNGIIEQAKLQKEIIVIECKGNKKIIGNLEILKKYYPYFKGGIHFKNESLDEDDKDMRVLELKEFSEQAVNYVINFAEDSEQYHKQMTQTIDQAEKEFILKLNRVNYYLNNIKSNIEDFRNANKLFMEMEKEFEALSEKLETLVEKNLNYTFERNKDINNVIKELTTKYENAEREIGSISTQMTTLFQDYSSHFSDPNFYEVIKFRNKKLSEQINSIKEFQPFKNLPKNSAGDLAKVQKSMIFEIKKLLEFLGHNDELEAQLKKELLNITDVDTLLEIMTQSPFDPVFAEQIVPEASEFFQHPAIADVDQDYIFYYLKKGNFIPVQHLFAGISNWVEAQAAKQRVPANQIWSLIVEDGKKMIDYFHFENFSSFDYHRIRQKIPALERIKCDEKFNYPGGKKIFRTCHRIPAHELNVYTSVEKTHTFGNLTVSISNGFNHTSKPNHHWIGVSISSRLTDFNLKMQISDLTFDTKNCPADQFYVRDDIYENKKSKGFHLTASQIQENQLLNKSIALLVEVEML